MKEYFLDDKTKREYKLCSDSTYYNALYKLVDSAFDKKQILCLLFDAPGKGIENIIEETFEYNDLLGRLIEKDFAERRGEV